MPTIRPAEIRAMVQRIASDGNIDGADVNKLMDAAMDDKVLSLSERTELKAVLEQHADKIDSPETKQKLQSFLSMTDGAVRHMAHKLEREDGVLDIGDANKLAELVNKDGKVSGSEKFSLHAVMIGSKLTDDAKTRLSDLAAGTTQPPASLDKVSTPKVAIPDNNSAGVSDTIRFDGTGTVADLRVELDLEHTYRGDLSVSLVGPDGTEVKLHSKGGGGDDDLIGVYPTDLQPKESLDKLKGKPLSGDWTIKVVDSANRDVGTLNSWKLSLTPSTEPPPPPPPPTGVTTKSSAPNVAIPDNQAGGISDSIRLEGEGTIESLKIDLDLAHTYRGDLMVSLVGPDGTEVALHNRSGGGTDDLVGSYPGTLTPAQSLDAFKGKTFDGEWKLKVSDHAGRDVGTVKSWKLSVTHAGGGGNPTGDAIELGKTAAQRPVFLSPAGFFVENKNTEKPSNNIELSSGMFRMAQLVDDAANNPFANADLPLATRHKVLENLNQALAKVPAGGNPPAGLEPVQALQLRSSSVTVLRSLLASAGSSRDELALKMAAFDAYKQALGAETNPILRDSMIFNLHAIKDKLTPAMKEVSDKYMNEVAPTSPPYDEWFKDGNDTLNVSWTSGQGSEGFYRGTVAMLKKKGFEPEGPEREGGPVVYVKTITNRNGVDTKVRIKCSENRNSIFDDMGKDDVHIVGYDGHSDIGRAVPASLRGAPDESGKKLVFYGLCAGKDNLHRMRERYPDSQQLTTFTSSFFNTTEVDGRSQMSRSENFNVLMELVEGAAERRPWTSINRGIRENAILFPWSHVMPGGTNYISPVHTMIRRKALDSDHDGQADVMDKLLNFDTTKVSEETRREFEAIDPGRPANKLDGTRIHLAAMALNTATGYNSVTKDYKKGNIIGAGYFEPQPGDNEIVKFERKTVEGQPTLFMKVNSHFAHMSEESLRAVAQFKFIQEIANSDRSNRMSDVEKKMMGLVFASFSIMYDEAYYSRDAKIFEGLLEAYNLPQDIPFNSIRSLLNDEHHDYSGNMTHVKKWMEDLSPAALEALERDDVGVR